MFFLAVLDGPMTSLDSFLKLLCGFRVVVPDKEVSLERVVLHHLVLVKPVSTRRILFQLPYLKSANVTLFCVTEVGQILVGSDGKFVACRVGPITNYCGNMTKRTFNN